MAIRPYRPGQGVSFEQRLRSSALGTGTGGMAGLRRALRTGGGGGGGDGSDGQYTLRVTTEVDDTALQNVGMDADQAVFMARNRLAAVNALGVSSAASLGRALEDARAEQLMAPTYRERVKGKLAALWDRAKAIRGGGTRGSYFEFGAEGVRAGDLRLSRSGLSLSEKTFVGSRGVGYAAVAGQVIGTAASVIAQFEQSATEREKYSAKGRLLGIELGSTAMVGVEHGLQLAAKLSDQATAIFGGDKIVASALWAIDKAFKGKVLGGLKYTDIVQGLQKQFERTTNNLSLVGAMNEAAKERAEFHKLRQQQKALDIQFWNALHDRLDRAYADSPEAQLRYLRTKVRALAHQAVVYTVTDFRGERAYKVHQLAEGEGR